MFEFKDLDGMDRLEMLQHLKDAKDYWTSLHHLKGAFLAWGQSTTALLSNYRLEGQDSKLIKAMDNAALRGEITVKKIANRLKKLDEYIREMDTRLSDGTKWYNAIDIAKMAEETAGVRNENATS